jgi:hypothetical protein
MGIIDTALEAVLPSTLKAAVGLFDRFIPDPAAREAAKLALMTKEGEQALAEMQVSMSAILAEANSADPWTSRARPAFLYVVYILLLAALPMGMLSAFNPDAAKAIATGFGAWLAAIPEPIITLFGIGYLGYTGARSFDKWRGQS